MNNIIMQKGIDSSFISYCTHGDLAGIERLNQMYPYPRKSFFKSLFNIAPSGVALNIHINDEQGLRLACSMGHLAVVRYLLTSPAITAAGHADIHAKQDNALTLACANNQVQVVEYLLQSPELKEHASLVNNQHQAIIACCETGESDMLHYLLHHEQFKPEEFSNNAYMQALQTACSKGFAYIVEYLLTYPRLRSSFTRATSLQAQLLIACHYNDMDVIRYLIMEEEIEQTPTIEQYLHYTQATGTLKMFQTRHLSKRLQQELPMHAQAIPKKKL